MVYGNQGKILIATKDDRKRQKYRMHFWRCPVGALFGLLLKDGKGLGLIKNGDETNRTAN
jgi:hypothetical protein